MLIEKPAAHTTASVPTSEIGIATAGAIVAPIEARNSRITRITITVAIRRLLTISVTASRMKIASSETTAISTPAGSERLSSSTVRRTASEMAMVFDWA